MTYLPLTDSKRWRCFLSTVGIVTCLAAHAARAEDPTVLNRDEVATRIAALTGTTRDASALALKAPEKLDKAVGILVAIQFYTQLAEAKDEDAAATAIDWAMGKAKDHLLKGAGSAASALSAFQVYKASLEGIRDFAVMPALDERMYRIYKQERVAIDTQAGGGDGNTSAGDAFGIASNAGGYHMLQDRIYAEMIRSRGFNAALIDARFESLLRLQIDNYWTRRMEIRYQREYAVEHRADLIAKYRKLAQESIGQVGPPVGGQAKGTTNRDAETVIASFIAGQEARPKDMVASARRQGDMDVQYRMRWPVKPHMEGNDVVYAQVIEVKRDKDHPWSETGAFGSAEHPARIPLPTIRAQCPAP